MEAVTFLNPGSEYDESTLVALRTTTDCFRQGIALSKETTVTVPYA
jgi:hypothetical protein